MIKFLLIVYFYGTKNYQSIFLNSVSNIYIYILLYITILLYYLYIYSICTPNILHEEV